MFYISIAIVIRYVIFKSTKFVDIICSILENTDFSDEGGETRTHKSRPGWQIRNLLRLPVSPRPHRVAKNKKRERKPQANETFPRLAFEGTRGEAQALAIFKSPYSSQEVFKSWIESGLSCSSRRFSVLWRVWTPFPCLVAY